eukprot:TRINITY_DN1607_c0_g1_i3.p1 TRINITY_DN1607_c0_g1~~TRINITY_DN1607_c0_g1_i3.p1  ORF type:complete len:232 (-),score=44.44 TRINITY_DN1607_c0_g1_i3:86-700(-)
MGITTKECVRCLVRQQVGPDDLFCSKCGTPYAPSYAETDPSVLTPPVPRKEATSYVFSSEGNATGIESQSAPEASSSAKDPLKQISMFGGKLLSFGRTTATAVSDSAKSTGAAIASGATAAAGHIQGRVAPTTLTKAGFLSKFYLPHPVYSASAARSPNYNADEWTDHYFCLRDGALHVLPYPDADKSDISIGLEYVESVKQAP